MTGKLRMICSRISKSMEGCSIRRRRRRRRRGTTTRWRTKRTRRRRNQATSTQLTNRINESS
jgi:hypothetical protein